MTSQKPIAVFDSGVGGLTVLKALRTALPGQNFIYLGDTARLPYGSKNPKTIRAYLEQCLDFLMQFDPQGFVVACNSASTQVRESTWQDRPLINVIDPVVHTACELSQNKKIGVIGTRATVNSHVFQDRIKKIDPQIEVFEVPCPLFVPLAEEGWIDDPITNLIAYRYLAPLIQQNIDTLVLGCTHYPILKIAIQKAMGNQTDLLEAGPIIAEVLKHLIQKSQLTPTSQGDLQMFLTDRSPHLDQWARQLLSLPTEFEMNWVHLNKS